MLRGGVLRVVLESGEASDIIMIAGMSEATVSHTICNPAVTEAIPAQAIDPPTISMMFSTNDSPLGGREGDKLTSAMIRDRVMKEIENNVSFSIGKQVGGLSESCMVMARGSMQLAVLIEEMRREGFELSIGPPRVLFKNDEQNGKLEPIEEVVCEMGSDYSGNVMDALATRKGEVLEVAHVAGDRVRLVARVPSRTLMGYRSEFNTSTRGTGVLCAVFHDYEPYRGGAVDVRKGVIVSTDRGEATTYSLGDLPLTAFSPVSVWFMFRCDRASG